MSSRTCASKTPAQARLAEVVAAYIKHLMDLQASGSDQASLDDVMIPSPSDKYPSHDFFCAIHTPPISLESYTHRLVTYMHCSPESFVFAVAYLRRLVLSGFPVHMRSVHRLLLTAVLVALKCRDDLCYHISFYAEVGGVTPKDLRTMEIRFLSDLIHFESGISLEDYHTVMEDITRVTSRRVIVKSISNDSGLCSPCGVSASSSAASSPSNLSCPGGKSAAFAPLWTSECELFWGR
ncbi:hypothetical protein JKF63_03155 [Porcisia hertigi]|uniref:Cyclin n=1 Tax=Porcisia hertigi TaxID=2761500 RepID=A0A836IJ68_9TRYP|nr:hypothetical protein JKF63_03155 [Porcisia hertigi]